MYHHYTKQDIIFIYKAAAHDDAVKKNKPKTNKNEYKH